MALVRAECVVYGSCFWSPSMQVKPTMRPIRSGKGSVWQKPAPLSEHWHERECTGRHMWRNTRTRELDYEEHFQMYPWTVVRRSQEDAGCDAREVCRPVLSEEATGEFTSRVPSLP